MNEADAQSLSYVDPDPFVVASLLISVAALALQFIQTVKACQKPDEPRETGSSRLSSIEITQIENLQTELAQARSHIRSVTRSVERGSRNSDQEFYDAKFELSATSLVLSHEHHQIYGSNLGQAYSRVGNVAIWANGIIGNERIATRIGKYLQVRVPDASMHLNSLIKNCGEIRKILLETNRVLDALEGSMKEISEDN